MTTNTTIILNTTMTSATTNTTNTSNTTSTSTTTTIITIITIKECMFVFASDSASDCSI